MAKTNGENRKRKITMRILALTIAAWRGHRVIEKG
jgi:hypothetical protein